MKKFSLLLILAVASTSHGAESDKNSKATAKAAKAARKAKAQSWLKPTGPEPPADRCTIQSLRLAIDDLATTFGSQYPRADKFRAQLKQVEALQDEEAQQEALTALAREALLANPLLDFDKLLVVRRNLGTRARQAIGGALGQPTLNSRTLDTQTQPGTGWNDAIVEISNLRGTPAVRPIYEPVQNRIIAEMDLHFDGERIMFSSGNEQNKWNVYEIKEGDAQPTQLTPDVPDVAFFDSCYLPDGKIALTSTAVYQGIPCQNGKGASAVLYRLDPATKEIRQLTFEQDSDWCPTVTNDGRIMYLRWEYTDLPHYFSRILFSCNPDGTEQMAVYGTNSYFPNAFYSARPIPGHATRVIGVASGHHGVPRSGRLLLIDPGQGRAEADGVVQEIPGYGKPVEPIIRDRLVDGVWPQFLCPYPLSNNYHIVSMKRSAGSLWGLYLVDVFDNRLLLAETEECALLDPLPYRPTPTPPVIPDRIDPTKKTATVLLSDVYFGPGLEGVPRGTVKRLRLFSYHFAHLGRGGHQSVGAEAGWDVKRILGTVPVDGDGSALFTIPANTPISVQPLDEKGRALQLMRSWLVGMPGEVVSCNGCHEDTSLAPPKPQPTGALRKPSRITQWYGPPRPFAFESEVRPVLDKYCVACHDGSQRGVSNLAKGNAGSYKADAGYMTLQKYIRRPGPESDIHLTTPLEYHASTSELIQMLEKGHHNVQLDEEAWSRLTTWIDLNVPHRGSWQPAEFAGMPQQERRVELASIYAGVDLDMEAEFTTVLESALRQPKPKPIMPDPLPEYKPREIEVPGWPFTAEAPADSRDIMLDLGEGVTMELVPIPAGRFIMGSATGSLDERPRAAVAIDEPFWMGRVEVTNRQFLRFDPTHESKYIDLGGKDHGTRGVPANGPQQPVIRVSWQQAMAFCRWLSEKTGRRVTLPTESQWEWACRAGTATPLWFGNLDASYSNYANLVKSVGNYSHNLPRGRAKAGNVTSVPVSVGSYEPNRWRLHDTHGNVAEWTRSSYRPYPYVAHDGRNDADSTERKAVRGGSWCDRPTRSTSSFRLAYQPWQKVVDVGFRVIVEP